MAKSGVIEVYGTTQLLYEKCPHLNVAYMVFEQAVPNYEETIANDPRNKIHLKICGWE